MRQQETQERRGRQRFPIVLPIVIAGNSGTEIQGVTQNMSAEGVFFQAREWPSELSSISFKMIFPKEITGTESIRVICKGTIVRLEEGLRGVGVATTIDSYRFG